MGRAEALKINAMSGEQVISDKPVSTDQALSKFQTYRTAYLALRSLFVVRFLEHTTVSCGAVSVESLDTGDGIPIEWRICFSSCESQRIDFAACAPIQMHFEKK